MRISHSLAIMAGLLALSACGKKHEEPPVEDNMVVEEPENVTNEIPPLAQPPVEENSAQPVENRIAPPQISEEQQMQDDAEATGMTSRLPDEEGTSAVVH